jgi:hypothetical protein
MVETYGPPRRGELDMGFTTHDVVSFAQSLLTVTGVVRVWIEPEDPVRAATVWVAMRGFDEEGHNNRIHVRTVIEEFLRDRVDDLDSAGYILDYRVVIQDESLRQPRIPETAIPLAS